MARFYLFISLLLSVQIQTLWASANSTDKKPLHIQAVYWQVKPYVYWDEKQKKMLGIYPLIFRKTAAYCTHKDVNSLVSYVKDFGSRSAFDQTMRSHSNYGEGALENVTTPDAVAWISYDTNIAKVGAKHFLRRNLTVLTLVQSEKLAVILPRRRISLPNKIVRGMSYCSLITVISLILLLLFGSIFWIIEKPYNDALKNKDGPIMCLYWSFVTMSTVGYGDVVPVTILGKLISIIWMAIGIMVAAVTVATLTDVVNGIEGLGIAGRDVAVVNDSHEEYFVQRDYFARPVLYETYEEIIQAVRDGDVYAGVLPYDIAVWKNEEIIGSNTDTPLSVVYLLDGTVPFNILVTLPSEGGDELIDCMTRKYKFEIISSSIELYKRHFIISTTHYGEVQELFLNNGMLQILSGVTLFVLLVAAVMYFWTMNKSKVEMKKMSKKKDIEEAVHELMLMLKEYRQMSKDENRIELTNIASSKH